jgi:hypothetical protein
MWRYRGVAAARPLNTPLSRMKHASPATLRQLEPLLVRIRGLGGLIERKPGTFYRRSSAFLHFHEDPDGVFADVKLNGVAFERLPVSNAQQRAAFWRALVAVCRESRS